MASRRHISKCVRYTRNTLIVILACFVVLVYKGQIALKSNWEQKLPGNIRKYAQFKEQAVKPLNVSEIRHQIHRFNKRQTIQNLDMYGPVKKETLILVISVSKLTIYLQNLIISLSFSRGIADAMIIFSHSYFDQNLNNFIRTIDFCRVMQIFFPQSLQTHPNDFPGFNPEDCPTDMSLSKANSTGCVGAATPDIHGRFRNPQTVEKKHYWWWTANTVFENLSAIQNHEGLVVFLEDDLYVLQDFIYMLLYMKEAAPDNQCDMLSLGAPTMVQEEMQSMYRVEVMSWDPRFHANALAFDLPVWNSIAGHYDLFCSVDDDSWARSLFYLSLHRKDGKRFKVMSTIHPRAIKLNGQSVYKKIMRQSWVVNVLEILNIEKKYRLFSYPPHLEIYTYIELESQDYRFYDSLQLSGGWADPRDVGLCMNLTVNKIKKVLTDIKGHYSEYEDTSAGAQWWKPDMYDRNIRIVS